MGGLGDLEQAIMETLWRSDDPLSANEIRASLSKKGSSDKTLAVTTILTVLSRLEHKGFVVRDRTARPHRYTAQRSRATHVADLMREVLDNSSDRSEALAYFVGRADESEVEVLRRLIDART